MKLKIGERYFSQADETEVIVVKAPADEVELTCAGQPMVDGASRTAAKIEPVADQLGGTLLGKRYTNDEKTVELLAVKPGQGTLALNGSPLDVQAAKALPSSD